MTAERSPSIAIVGMAGRFPGAEDIGAYWSNLERGIESLTEYSNAELLEAGVPAEYLDHPRLVKKGSPLEKAEHFDAAFFGFTPREAEITDPQHRIALECAWGALEDAGYGGRIEGRNVGVFAGAAINSYALANVLRNPAIAESISPYQYMLASDKDFLATRISYKLDLKGPSFAVQTACSTSLVAVQLACDSLLANHCDVALAGGVALHFPAKTGYLYEEGMIFSPDGHCRPFDAEGRGIRGGDGVGFVVLRRLEDALRDRDSIRAIILGAVINNDGGSKMGYTAPSVEGQSRAISAALQMADVQPDSITYIEAHGTATPMGDPIEIASLDQVFRASTEKRRFCAIGAVKSNIGHLDTAAGVAGLIKTVLALQHQQIPPTLHFKNPNPAINFADSCFYVNTALAEWPSDGKPRRAGVSSFGIGGTNAHVTLEEAPAPETSEVRWPTQLLTLSARTPSALAAAGKNLAGHITANPSLSLADICYTLQVGRTPMQHRRAFVCSDIAEAVECLLGRSPKLTVAGSGEFSKPSVVFMFSGQGSQYNAMGRELFETEPVFRRTIDRCAELLRLELACDLRDKLYHAEDDSVLNQTWLTQPALFAVEYALAQMWMSWGVVPEAMIGHSVGEYVAACLAGVFSLADALRIVAARGRLMQSMPEGSMLAVALPPQELLPLINGQLSLAAVNAPALCTVSGPACAVDSLRTRLSETGVQTRPLHTSHAFHSDMMDPAIRPFVEVLKTIKLAPPSLPFVSNLTGTWIGEGESVDPGYWARHLRETVRFAQGISQLLEARDRVFLEVGPGQVLSTFVRQRQPYQNPSESLISLPHSKALESTSSVILNTVGKLWTAGVPIQWSALHAGEKLHRVSLPTYPFERQLYTVKPEARNEKAEPRPSDRADFKDWFYAPSWRRSAPPSARLTTRNFGPWLIFSDDEDLTASITQAFSTDGHLAGVVRPGEVFAQFGECQYSINPRDPEHYKQLIGRVLSSGTPPRSILYLCRKTQARDSFDALLFLAQAFGDSSFREEMDWIVVSYGMHAISSGDTVDPLQALVLGPCRVIPLEHANIRCRCVDVSGCEELRRILPELALEPAVQNTAPVIAYRDGFRWEQTLESIQLPEQPVEKIRHGGVYVITGGTGGIGLTLAQYLAGFQTRIALVGRSVMPARDNWDSWLGNHDESDRVCRMIRDVRTLEERGAEVMTVSADITDEVTLKTAIESIRQRFGTIHGIIHAAGIAGGGLVQLKTAAAAHKVLAPKVTATLALAKLLKDAPLDFFVLCSSVDSLCGAAGAVDYCAANAFLDAFAASRLKPSPIFISINWDTWQEVGMAVNTAVPESLRSIREQTLRLGIKPAEGVEAFRRVLSSGLPQIAVLTRDLATRSYIPESQHSNTADPGPARTESDSSTAVHFRSELGTVYESPSTETQRAIAAIWKEMLGIRDLGIDDNFFELGGHSLLATGILSRIQRNLGIVIPLRTLFESPTIRSLSDHVDTIRWVNTEVREQDSEDREKVEF